jgi:hypothetical protein
MSFQVSAGINVSEIDLTTIVPAVSTTDGAIGGVFRWGPVEERLLVDNENTLVSRFGKPSNLNAETWLTAASFLGYGNRLHVSRAANTAGVSPIATSATIQSGNATIVVASTAGLTNAMFVASSTGNSLAVGAKIASVPNATHVILASNNSALVNASGASIQFVTNTAFTAIANSGSVANLAGQIVKSKNDFDSKSIDTYDSDVHFVAKFPGEIGNSLRISVCANPSGYSTSINLASSTYAISNGTTTKTTVVTAPVNSSNATVTVTVDSSDLASSNTDANTTVWALYNELNVTDRLELGTQKMKITAISAPAVTGNTTNAVATFTVSFDDIVKQASNVSVNSTLNRYWEYYNTFDGAPAKSDYQTSFGNTSVNSDEMHVVVVDEMGKFSGVPGTILEAYKAVSRATDAKTIDGGANYYKDVINENSNYVFAINDLSGAASASAAQLTSATADVVSFNFTMGKDGVDESNIGLTDLAAAYDQFVSSEDVDISLILTGKTLDSTGQLANYLIDNLAEVRKDCVVFISPAKSDVVGKSGSEAADAVVATRNNLRSTSYAVMDSGYKYMYDRYNDLYRWVPLNGDVAGLCARTDVTNDPWWSPAGLNRGQIKNLVKLAYNPSKADRDTLYKSGVNPVVTFPGQGTILYGDKTLLSKPSAFDRINVRRLFIVLEKAIARASRSTLFEFNDTFTRSQFRNLVIPYLRDVQGRRGVTDFLVVCDETNNTPEVIDRNEFVGDIYIKPARSINFIQLNFVAVRTGVAFSEVVGQF